jgi:hypothetical protein
MKSTCEACGGMPCSTGGKFCQWCLDLSHYERVLLTQLRTIGQALAPIAELLPDLSKWT